MVDVKDAREAEQLVRSEYSGVFDLKPQNFQTSKRGDTWIVKFKQQGPLSVKDCEWHIKSKGGKVIKK
jgi:hypothetical protein